MLQWALWDGAVDMGEGPRWAPHYLNVLPKEVGVEAEPVGGDVKPSLDEDVPLQRTGADCRAERCQSPVAPHLLPRTAPHCPPFSTLSSVGMSLNSLWYWELYLLAACKRAEQNSEEEEEIGALGGGHQQPALNGSGRRSHRHSHR